MCFIYLNTSTKESHNRGIRFRNLKNMKSMQKPLSSTELAQYFEKPLQHMTPNSSELIN